MLRPALADAKWGPWAQRAYAAAVRDRAYYLMRARNFAESIVEFEHALAAAAETDRRLDSKRPGLRAADVDVDYSEVLWSAGRRDEARSVTARAERSLREFARREPHLAGVRMQLARLVRNLRNQAWPQWKFKEVIASLDEQESEYGHVLSRDPGNVDIFGLLAGVCVDTSSRFACAWREGDFAAADVYAQRGVEHAQKPAAIPFWQTNLITAHLSWARVCAATGRNRETDHQLSAAEQVARQLAERTPDRESAVIYWANFETRRREVEMERLNWREVAENATRSLDRLSSLERHGDSSRISNAVRIAHRDLMRAAFESGDYATARRELNGWLPQYRPLNQTGDIFPRFSRLGETLLRIEVLVRAGEHQVATSELDTIWPEVEQVFAAGPDYLFNRIQTARALAIRAELDADAARKRVWLERALGYFRPAAAAGRLTRYEREVLLAGIDEQVSALGANAR
jgi:hypothetical protein